MIAKRAKVKLTATARIKRWQGRRAAACEIKSLYGLPTYFAVVVPVENGGEKIVSKHRKKRIALEVAERLEGIESQGMLFTT